MDEEQIKKIFERYINKKAISITSILNKGNVNQIYLIQTEVEKYILRMDLNEYSIDRFTKESWCMLAARQQGIITTETLALDLAYNHPFIIMPYYRRN